ncbi:ubiquitin specific protease 39 [Haemaphysalis longicornis]
MASPPDAKKRKVDETPKTPSVRPQPAQGKRRNCPYLDTINRNVLDFDFEKLCSVSLSRINVYACLVCGKYFQGRGTNTHAYTHSVQVSHHVFLNLQTLRFYCLPDNYEIVDSSLDDITYVLRPTFTKGDIVRLDTSERLSRAYDGTTYLPGIVGLNNIKANDYCNVVLQALSHVPPLRNYFLREENYASLKRPPGDINSLIVQRFGELIRKLWNPRNFKAHVSPHEMLQAVVLCSKKRFQITKQGDPIDFLSWFLNSLHMALNGTHKVSSSIVYRTFRGGMNVYSRKVIPVEMTEAERRAALRTTEYDEKVENTGFMYLTADLPAQPLFKDEMRENIIPQVPLFTILSKFNGTSEKEYRTYKDSTLKRFELTALPPYLILYIKRFTKNTFFVEKNPTIVNFPIKDVDLGELVATSVPDSEEGTYVYDLIANIVHEGEPGSGKGTYRAHILHRGSGKWYELQDLHVTEILPQMITLSEAYIQIWERRRKKPEAAPAVSPE